LLAKSQKAADEEKMALSEFFFPENEVNCFGDVRHRETRLPQFFFDGQEISRRVVQSARRTILAVNSSLQKSYTKISIINFKKNVWNQACLFVNQDNFGRCLEEH